MDRRKETADVIIGLNQYHRGTLADHELVRLVCTYFDQIKAETLGQADLSFLRYLANAVGIPHFYDLLESFGKVLSHEEHNLNTLSSMLYESTLHTSEENKVHRYQYQILDLFRPGALNRFFLSASTSFGKTHVVFELIKKMEYENVVLIFPTIALLSENLEKILSDERYSYFKESYAVHTLSEVEEFGERNLFIFTPERFLSFIEKQEQHIDFDFAFIDEVYKIDNDYIIDEEVRENERDVAYRLAVFYSLKDDVDVLLAGPYIDFSKIGSKGYNGSFDAFLRANRIQLIDFNDYEIVNKSYKDIKSAMSVNVDEALSLKFTSTNKTQRLEDMVKSLLGIGENAIVYCASRSGAESYAKTLIDSGILAQHDSSEYDDFLNHIARFFGEDWVVHRALKNGIGIHHGLVPKYIQKEIIHLFNRSKLVVLFSTTTITEGVNTSAKNLIVLHSKKGTKDLKKFDAKNIAGRAGRFLYHYSGRVLVLQNDFMKKINAEPEGIKHKNYDPSSPKDEIDLYYTPQEYLQDGDRIKLSDIAAAQQARGIPDEIFNLYKVISRIDKITIYDAIQDLGPADLAAIGALIRRLNYQLDIDSDGFQVILDVILPIVKNQKLRFLIERKDRNDKYSILTHFVHFYLVGGFISSMEYKINFQGKSKDDAIKETAEFVYNTLKYQVVKYLGVFNIMYKFSQSKKLNVPFEQVLGIDRLLTKLEYNALTESGRMASDYGVPASIVNYYESEDNRAAIRAAFDSYETFIFNKISSIIDKRE